MNPTFEIVIRFQEKEYRAPIDIPTEKWSGRFWRMPIIIRFFSKIKINEATGCWIWQGVIQNSGYGLLGGGGKHGGMRTAHRFSYEHFKGPLPRGAIVCHKCDVKSCVNPDHLFSGSHSDNTQDARSKFRLRGPGKLTDEEVRQIRMDYGTGKYSMAALATKYPKVAGNSMWKIVRFKSHLWVTPTEEEKKCLEQRTSRKVTPAALATVRRRYLAGERPTDLAKAYGITATRVIQIGKHNY